MAIVFIRAVVLYMLLIFSVRLMGKHQIGELQPSELAVTILISNIATLPVEDASTPLLIGILPILTLACIDVIMSWLGVKSRRLRTLTCGKPVVVISNGEIDQKKMKDIRFSVDDLVSVLRSQGIFDISEVQFAVVETTGSVSVYQKRPYQTATNMSVNPDENYDKSDNPPELVIEQGKIIPGALERLKISEENIRVILEKEKVLMRNVFIMTIDAKEDYNIIRKEA